MVISKMLFSLERVPLDILQHIALLGASSGLEPPLDLCRLLATCRAFYEGLNIYSSPHLYAAIFKLKYDAESRTPLTNSSLASELVQRCRALRRCRRLDMSIQGLRQDLWTLLWMLLEEGRCEPITQAGFPRFIIELAQYYLREDVWLCEEIKHLVIWLLCLGLTRQDILSQNPEVRNTLLALLRPFSISASGVLPPFTSPPPTSSAVALQTNRVFAAAVRRTLPHVVLQGYADEELVRYNARIRAPTLLPVSAAAIILIFALKEAVTLQIPFHLPATRALAIAENRSGPTAEDYIAFQRAGTLLFSDVRTTVTPHPSASTTLNFLELDPWISDVLAIRGFSPEKRARYPAGSLTGVWEGSLMIASCVSVGDADYVSATPDYLCRTPMQCEFSEYFCFGPPLLGGNSHPPLRESDIRHESETSPYQKFTPGEDFQHESQFAHPAHEHILIGQTLREHEDAWGAGGFNFTGRVHDNGRIVFSRQPKDDESETPETWVFEGHLRYGTALVGAFRSSSADGPCGVQGIFSLRKRAEAPMQ